MGWHTRKIPGTEKVPVKHESLSPLTLHTPVLYFMGWVASLWRAWIMDCFLCGQSSSSSPVRDWESSKFPQLHYEFTVGPLDQKSVIKSTLIFTLNLPISVQSCDQKKKKMEIRKATQMFWCFMFWNHFNVLKSFIPLASVQYHYFVDFPFNMPLVLKDCP